ncbi:MAG: enoyl-CoA hydratase-related protein, partial [Gammaproteobacteria bacterium]|nr:enoyl-CoA hydratase-related protein [Gammaproteobacteria bacterium]
MTVSVLQFDLQNTPPEARVRWVDLAREREPVSAAATTLHVGLDAAGQLPRVALQHFDVLLTTAVDAPRPWITLPAGEFTPACKRLGTAVGTYGLTAAVLAQVLRAGTSLSFDDALTIESIAFSMLLGGAAFRRWLAAQHASILNRRRHRPRDDAMRVRGARNGAQLMLWLSRPECRNAVDARLRDQLCEWLANVCDDPTIESVIVRGEGADFCSGGDLSEFGNSEDVVFAHAVRTLRSPALLLHRLGPRATVYLHGN